jgi:hypothetical protein
MPKGFHVLTILLLTASAAGAQTISGSMSGTVVDAQKQVVPGADVVITNERTGEVRRTVTNEVGAFYFPGLAPGPYSVRAELTGFRPIESKGNMVLANGRLAVPPLVLQVGGVTEAVTVSAVGEAVATTTTAHEAILDLKQVENLSIRGRDPVSLLKILPGVSILDNDQEVFGGSFATNVPDVQGGRGQTIYIDGINAGDGGGGGNLSGATSVDAIAEVNVQMSAYTAEYGLKGGSQINFITKSGGSEYHGGAYWHVRNEAFNSLNYFNKKDNLPKPLYRFSNLGGSLGGPIPRIPKVNSDGNKLFFFYNIDDTQVKNPQQLRYYTMPTALERRGDFSQTRTPNGALIRILDPLTGQAFPGNRIPENRAHPAGVAFLNLLPTPNIDGDGYNFVYQEPSIDHPRRAQLLRVDYRPSLLDSISLKWQDFYTKSVGHNVAGASSRWGLVRQRYDFTHDIGKIDYTRILNTSTILEFSAGAFRSTEDGPPADDIALAGLQRASYPALNALPQFAPQHNPLGLIPEAQFGAVQSGSGSSSTSGSEVRPASNIFYDNRWPITGEDSALNLGVNLTHTRGAHTFKLGVMREHEVFGQARSGIFAGEFDFSRDSDNPLDTDYAYSNAFLGVVRNYDEDLGRRPDFRIQKTWAWFVQDTWKLRPSLTLDIGLRMYKWDHPLSGSGEASAFSFERFDPTWGGKPPLLFEPVRVNGDRMGRNPQTGEIVPETFIGLMVPGTGYTCGVITPGEPCEINGIVTQNDPTYRDGDAGFVDPLPIQFDPRFGLAWSPNPKTVIRASTGLFHDGTGGNDFRGGPAFQFRRTTWYTDLNSYLTGGSAVAPVDVEGIVRTDPKRPSTHKYTVGIERELGWNIVADVAYVGEYTRYLNDTFNYNAVPAGAEFLPENRDPTQTPSASNPRALPDVFLRPIRGFGDIEIDEPINSARYDSLQAQVSRRFTGNFEMAGSYTYAKGYTIDRWQGNPLTGTFRSYNGDLQDHVLVLSYLYDIPGGAHLLGDSALARGLFNNWRISGISTFASGKWFDVSTAYSPSFEFSGGGESCDFLYINGDPNDGPRTEAEWFDTSVFSAARGRGDLGGACGNREVEGPGHQNHDISVFKDFSLPGNQRVTFKAEVYNLLDHVQFDDIDTSARFNASGEQIDTNFGRATSARNERRMVFSLRYTF